MSHYWGVGGYVKTGETIGSTDPDYGLAANNGAFFPGIGVKLSEITDGTSNTIGLGERTYVWRTWMVGARWKGQTNKIVCAEASNNVTYPLNASHEQYGYYIGDNLRPEGTTADIPLNNLWFGSLHPGGVHFAFIDGSCHFLQDQLELEVLQELSTIHGDEINRWKP